MPAQPGEGLLITHPAGLHREPEGVCRLSHDLDRPPELSLDPSDQVAAATSIH